MAKKIKSLNLALVELTNEKLGEIASKIVDKVEEFLSEVLPRKTEYDLTVKLVKKEDHIDFIIDLGIRGGYIGVINYEKLIGDAINIARRVLENELRKFSQDPRASSGSKGEENSSSNT